MEKELLLVLSEIRNPEWERAALQVAEDLGRWKPGSSGGLCSEASGQLLLQRCVWEGEKNVGAQKAAF